VIFVSVFDTLPDSDERKAREKGIKAKKRRLNIRRIRSPKKRAVHQERPAAPVVPQPVRPFREPKRSGVAARVRLASTSHFGRLLSPVQLVNGVVGAVVLLVVIHLLHGWSRFTLMGVVVGVIFTMVELQLLSWAQTVNEKHRDKADVIYRVAPFAVVGLAVAWGVHKVFPGTEFAVMVVFAEIFAVADPLGFYYDKSKKLLERKQLEQDRVDFDAWKEGQEAAITSKLEKVAAASADVANMYTRLELKRQSFDEDAAAEEAEKEAKLYRTVTKAVQTTVDIVGAKERLEAAEAEARTIAERYQRTRAEIEAEVREEYEQRRALQSGQSFIPPPDEQPTDDQGRIAHQVVTPDSEFVGYDLRD
jgi:hypothetical protein